MSRCASFAAAALTVVIAGAAIWYVSAPPKGSDGYRERMADATRTLRSQVQSARIWAATFEDGDATSAATAVGFEEAERDASSAASQFEAYDPARRDLRLRSRFVALAADATGALADLRIAAELEDWERVPEVAGRLDKLAASLERFERRARP